MAGIEERIETLSEKGPDLECGGDCGRHDILVFRLFRVLHGWGREPSQVGFLGDGDLTEVCGKVPGPIIMTAMQVNLFRTLIVYIMFCLLVQFSLCLCSVTLFYWHTSSVVRVR